MMTEDRTLSLPIGIELLEKVGQKRIILMVPPGFDPIYDNESIFKLTYESWLVPKVIGAECGRLGVLLFAWSFD